MNFFGFLVITRNPPERFWGKLVESFPFNLPDLPQTSRTSKNLGKTKFLLGGLGPPDPPHFFAEELLKNFFLFFKVKNRPFMYPPFGLLAAWVPMARDPGPLMFAFGWPLVAGILIL